MMGFLNKFMDAIGVELEQSVVAEVSHTMGSDWSPGKAGALLDPTAPYRPNPPVDGVRTKLQLLPLLPAAIRLDRRYQRGTPKRSRDVAAFLTECTGHDFPVLAQLRSGRARRSIASMLRENLDPQSSVVGVGSKVLTGAIFAEVVHDEHLAEDIRTLARHAQVDSSRQGKAAAFGRGDHAIPPTDNPTEAAALVLARAAAHSPARVDASTVAACHESGLPPAAVVEIITWLSVLQMLHRLTCYAMVAGDDVANLRARQRRDRA